MSTLIFLMQVPSFVLAVAAISWGGNAKTRIIGLFIFVCSLTSMVALAKP